MSATRASQLPSWERKCELVARHAPNSGFKSRKKASPAKLLISLGPIAAFATLIARRPRAAGLLVALPAAALVALFLFEYFGLGGTAAHQIGPAAYARTEQTLSGRSDAQSARQNPAIASAPPNPSKDNKASTTLTNLPPGRSISMVRDPALENWFIASYLKCWSPPANLPTGEKYGVQIRVVHKVDGSLAAVPRLVNPPMDPEWRPYADSAVHAVTKCNPLHVPPQYVAQFDQWKKMTLHF
jgi:hypothetical protein